MKKINIYRLVITLIIIFLTTYSMVHGQPPLPPGGHGMNGNGGSAPVDGGSLLLLLGGLGYGTLKVIRANKGNSGG
jgi:hypothetical protein